MVKEDIKKGVHKDWGMSVDGSMGYAISELGEKELYANMMRFMPYTEFKVYPYIIGRPSDKHHSRGCESHQKIGPEKGSYYTFLLLFKAKITIHNTKCTRHLLNFHSIKKNLCHIYCV